MSESYSLPTKPEDMVAALVERFNSSRVGELLPLYEPEVVLVKPDGRTVTGHAEMAADLEYLVSFGLPLKASVRHVFAAGDTAEIIRHAAGARKDGAAQKEPPGGAGPRSRPIMRWAGPGAD